MNDMSYLEKRRLWGSRANVTNGGIANQVRILTLPQSAINTRDFGSMIGVVVSVTPITIAATLNTFRIIARAEFHSGGGHGVVEFDVPAQGGSIALPAGEGLTVYAYGESADANVYDVHAMAAIVRAPMTQQAYRTTRDLLPVPAANFPQIPSFAREVRFISDAPALFGGVALTYWTGFNPAASMAVCSAAAGAGPILIPAGATHYQLTGAVQTITGFWGLCL